MIGEPTQPRKRNRRSVKAERLIGAILSLYEDGLTTREIAARLSASKSYVHRLLKERGLSRNKSKALAGKYFIEPRNRRAFHDRARKIVERFTGKKLQSNEHVHHINHICGQNGGPI